MNKDEKFGLGLIILASINLGVAVMVLACIVMENIS